MEIKNKLLIKISDLEGGIPNEAQIDCNGSNFEMELPQFEEKKGVNPKSFIRNMEDYMQYKIIENRNMDNPMAE